MQTSVSGFVFFLKIQNRVLKYLVSVLEKSFSVAFCSQVRALFIQSGPFSCSPGPSSSSLGPFLSSPDPFLLRLGLFSSRLGLFMLNGALIQTERPPYPKCLARLQNVPIINHSASPGPPFKIKGPLSSSEFLFYRCIY